MRGLTKAYKALLKNDTLGMEFGVLVADLPDLSISMWQRLLVKDRVKGREREGDGSKRERLKGRERDHHS